MSQMKKNKPIRLTDKSFLGELTLTTGKNLCTKTILEDDPILFIRTNSDPFIIPEEQYRQYPIIVIDKSNTAYCYYLEKERCLGELSDASIKILSIVVDAIIAMRNNVNGCFNTDTNLKEFSPELIYDTATKRVQDMNESKEEAFDFTITSEDVRRGVVRNPNMSIDTLLELSKGDDKNVRKDIDNELYTQLFKDIPDLKDNLLSLVKEGGTLELKINKVIDDNYKVAYTFPGLITDRTVQTYIENMIKNNKDSYDEPLVKFVIKQFKKEIINDLLNAASKEFDELADACRYTQLTSEAFEKFAKTVLSDNVK
jgi:23S rRNA U2552 (ribose-2'-O)-methylase RlmE/FtsJ